MSYYTDSSQVPTHPSKPIKPGQVPSYNQNHQFNPQYLQTNPNPPNNYAPNNELSFKEKNRVMYHSTITPSQSSSQASQLTNLSSLGRVVNQHPKNAFQMPQQNKLNQREGIKTQSTTYQAYFNQHAKQPNVGNSQQKKIESKLNPPASKQYINNANQTQVAETPEQKRKREILEIKSKLDEISKKMGNKNLKEINPKDDINRIQNFQKSRNHPIAQSVIFQNQFSKKQPANTGISMLDQLYSQKKNYPPTSSTQSNQKVVPKEENKVKSEVKSEVKNFPSKQKIEGLTIKNKLGIPDSTTSNFLTFNKQKEEEKTQEKGKYTQVKSSFPTPNNAKEGEKSGSNFNASSNSQSYNYSAQKNLNNQQLSPPLNYNSGSSSQKNNQTSITNSPIQTNSLNPQKIQPNTEVQNKQKIISSSSNNQPYSATNYLPVNTQQSKNVYKNETSNSQSNNSLSNNQQVNFQKSQTGTTSNTYNFSKNKNVYEGNVETKKPSEMGFMKKKEPMSFVEAEQKSFKKTNFMMRTQSFQEESKLPAEKKNKQFKKEDFIIGKKMGKGQFGQVLLVQHKETGFICGMKVMEKKQIIEEDYVGQIGRQLSIQFFLSHRNIAPLYGYFSDEKNAYLLVEFCTEGQLLQKLRGERRMQEQDVAQIMRQVCEGVDYIHKEQIIHRDIKPENILFNYGVVKICDFGWAVYRGSGMRKTASGSPLYYPPEIVKGEEYDDKIDVWNIGMMTYECILGKIPFRIYTELDLNRIVSDQITFPDWVDVTDTAKDFILKTMRKKGEERMQIRQMLRHPFLSKAGQKQLDSSILEDFRRVLS